MRGVRRNDRGSATVWVLALCGVLMSLGAAAVLVGGAVAGRHRAEAAADLAALAAAGRAVSGAADPCAAAASVASANGARAGVLHRAAGRDRGGAGHRGGDARPARPPAGLRTCAGRAGRARELTGSEDEVRLVRIGNGNCPPRPVPGRPARRGRRRGAGPRPPCRAGRCRCRTWATARRTGSPLSHSQAAIASPGGRAARPERRVAPLGEAGAAGVAVVDEDRERPVSGCRAVDTPPMSQRSQVANSGSSPIEACSAACAAPGKSRRRRRPGEQRPASTASPHRPGAQRRAGRSSGVSPSTSPVRAAAAGSATTWLSRRPCRSAAPVDGARVGRDGSSDDRDVGDVARRGGVVRVARPAPARRVLEVERPRPRRSRPGAGRPRRRAPSVGRRRRRRCRAAARCRLDHPHRRAAGCRACRRRGRARGAASTSRPAVGEAARGDQVVQQQLGRRRRTSSQSASVSGSSAAAHAQVRPEDVRVGRVEHRRLDRAAEERLAGGARGRCRAGRRARRGPRARPWPAPGPPGLLPERGDGAGEPGDQHRVEPGDVDAELERVGGGHAEQLAVGSARSSARRSSAGSRRGRRRPGCRAPGRPRRAAPPGAGRRRPRRRAGTGRTPASGRPRPPDRPAGRRPRRWPCGGPARRSRRCRSVQRRLPQGEGARPRGEPSSVTAATGSAGQPAGRRRRVGDGRRGEDEDRLGAVAARTSGAAGAAPAPRASRTPRGSRGTRR